MCFTGQKMKFFIKDLFSKYDQIRSFLHFCAVFFTFFQLYKWYETAQSITYLITYQLIPAFSPTTLYKTQEYLQGSHESWFRENSIQNLEVYLFSSFPGFLLCTYRSSCPEVFCKKDVLRNFAKFTGKHLCQSFFFDKVAGLRLAILLKKRPWRRCFPVNFAKFLKTLFLQNTSDGCFCTYWKMNFVYIVFILSLVGIDQNLKKNVGFNIYKLCKNHRNHLAK